MKYAATSLTWMTTVLVLQPAVYLVCLQRGLFRSLIIFVIKLMGRGLATPQKFNCFFKVSNYIAFIFSIRIRIRLSE